MSTRLFGNIKVGITSVSKPALLLKTADNTPDTGKLAAALTAYYYRQGASATASVSLSDLGTLNSTFSAGGIKEIGDGAYRVDWPDAAWATGADWVLLVLKDSTTSAYLEVVALETSGAADNAAAIAALPAASDVVTALAAHVPTVRNQDAVTAPNFDDCLVGAWCEAFAKETENDSAATYVTTKPDSSGPIRSFTLTKDTNGNPVARA